MTDDREATIEAHGVQLTRDSVSESDVAFDAATANQECDPEKAWRFISSTAR